MIKTVIFDIGNVLMRFDWSNWIKTKYDPQTVDIINNAMWMYGDWDELDRNVLTEEQIVSNFISHAPAYKDQILDVFNHVGECCFRQSYAIPWIEDLKARGYQTLFLSNYSHHTMTAAPHVLDFLPHLQGGVFSCDVKLIKPDPAIFACICEKYSLNPAECLFIDDNEDNIRSAKEFGLNAYRFTDYAASRTEIESILISQGLEGSAQ